MDSSELTYFFDNVTELLAMGFEFNMKEKSKVITFTAIPVLFDKNQVEQLFENFFSDKFKYEGFSKADVISKKLCRSMTINNGKSLNIEEQQQLLASLFACKEKNLSPFNRPIFINFDMQEIDKKIN